MISFESMFPKQGTLFSSNQIYCEGSPSPVSRTASSKTVSSLGLGNRIAMSPSSNYGLSDSMPVKGNDSPAVSSETLQSMIDIIPESQDSISLTFPDDLQVPESTNSLDSAFGRRRRKTMNKVIHRTPSPKKESKPSATEDIENSSKMWRNLGFSEENIPVIECVMDAVAEFERSLKKPSPAKKAAPAASPAPLQLRIASNPPPKIRRNNSSIIFRQHNGDAPVKRRADEAHRSKERSPVLAGQRHVRKKKAIEIPVVPIKELKKRSNTISAPKGRRASKKPVDVYSVDSEERQQRVPLKRKPSNNTNIPKRRFV